MGLDDLLRVVLKSSPELLKTGDYTTVVINRENGDIGNVIPCYTITITPVVSGKNRKERFSS